jgi:hypothetical protein
VPLARVPAQRLGRVLLQLHRAHGLERLPPHRPGHPALPCQNDWYHRDDVQGAFSALPFVVIPIPCFVSFAILSPFLVLFLSIPFSPRLCLSFSFPLRLFGGLLHPIVGSPSFQSTEPPIIFRPLCFEGLSVPDLAWPSSQTPLVSRLLASGVPPALTERLFACERADFSPSALAVGPRVRLASPSPGSCVWTIRAGVVNHPRFH